MFPLSLVVWWYSSGWRDQAHLIAVRLSRVSDNFSMTLLLRSLFAPFRQISADDNYGPGLDAKLRAWADKLISRCIGAMVRTVLIVFGLVLLLLESLIGLIRLVSWPFLPIMPIVGGILMASGWVPWRI